MKQLTLYLLTFCLVMAGALWTNATAQTVRYVTENGNGTKDGSSWANASDDLQDMINISTAGNEIWVAEGTYKPNRPANNLTTIDPNNRDNAFVLKEGVKLYGGFSRTETTIAGRAGGATVLSGDIDGDGTLNGNCYHVVIGVSTAANPITAATLIDGFTITGGNAEGNGNVSVNGVSFGRSFGGGMYNRNS